MLLCTDQTTPEALCSVAVFTLQRRCQQKCVQRKSGENSEGTGKSQEKFVHCQQFITGFVGKRKL